MLLDFIGTVVLVAVIIVNIVAVLGAMRLPVSGRLTLTVIVGLWIGLQAALVPAFAIV